MKARHYVGLVGLGCWLGLGIFPALGVQPVLVIVGGISLAIALMWDMIEELVKTFAGKK